MQTEPSVSIIIPCFNERDTIQLIFEKVKLSKINNKEIIIVDDGSVDGSIDKIKEISQNNHGINLKTVFHSSNQGKGSAIKSAIKVASKELILIQDADLEYDPIDYSILLEPFIKYGVQYGWYGFYRK